MRTELSRRVKLATEKPKDTIAQAKRVLGAWRARERVRKQADAADARMAAARSATLADAAAAIQAAPEPTGAKGTRRQWKMEVRNEPALRASMLRLVLAASQAGGGRIRSGQRCPQGNLWRRAGSIGGPAPRGCALRQRGRSAQGARQRRGRARGRAGRLGRHPHLL